MFQRLIFVFLAGLAACSPPLERVAIPAVESAVRLQPRVSNAMVRTVILPTYAAAEEIAFQGESGRIETNADVLWADDPQRGVTVAISRNLSNILGVDVGPDPWPFVTLPDAAVDIRVSDMLAGSDGVFRLSGQFFVGGDGTDFPNSSETFDIAQPLADQSLNSIANAQAAALLTLSEQIARRLGR